MLLSIRAFWSLSGTYAYENTNVASGPLVANSFIKSHRSWVVSAGAFIEENGLANLDGLKC
jgi:hypothetical protein